MAVTWNTPAGDLGILTERQTVSIPVSASSDVGNISYSVIAGNLPRGLRLSGNSIVGSPTEVTKFTESRFVIRAADSNDEKDRTFKLSVDGSDIPEWVTAEGFLNVGPAKAYFVLDNAFVNLQLEAYDPDEVAGDVIEYYLVPNSGELPPGLTLSRSGLISGFTDPVFAVAYASDDTGAFDSQGYDSMPLDIAESESNGFDSYFYDNQTYDYTEASRTPKRLSRIYTFSIAASDGLNSVHRTFKIYVVTEDFLKSDNSLLQVDTNLFQADSGSARSPFWITDPYLGRRRANNYVTVYLDVYDPPSLVGTIGYFLLDTNPGNYQLLSTEETVLGHYEIGGLVPSFSFTNKDEWNSETNYIVGDLVSYIDFSNYNFQGVWNSTTSYVENDYVIFRDTFYRCINDNSNKQPNEEVGSWRRISLQYYVCQKNSKNILPTNTVYWDSNLNFNTGKFTPTYTDSWRVVKKETVSALPPGMTLDSISGEVAGEVPYQAAVTNTYNFTVQAVNFPTALANINYSYAGVWSATRAYTINESVVYRNLIYICIEAHTNQIPQDGRYWVLGVASSERTFTIDIIGEIESAIKWITPSDRGTIKPNQPSQIYVKAEALIYGGRITYDFVSGELPPGLTFLPTGDIEGKVKQFADNDGLGLTRFYERDSSLIDSTGSRSFTITFDGDLTSFDRKFEFTIQARDYANVAESERKFSITVEATTEKSFANLYAKALQPKSKRLDWFNFITDFTIFKPEDMYRYGDPNFSVQTDLRVLLFAGIESKEAVEYVQAISRNHYRKRLQFGDAKLSIAKDPLTQEILYEVIYVDVIDTYEKNGKSISETIELKDDINSKVLISYDAIKVDSDIPLVSDSDHQRIFPNSIKNMRRRIRNVGERDREFLPLWMRSIQESGIYELGYTKALVLCYAKPGAGANVLARIRASNYDFKSIDFEIDRYIIDILDGQIEDKYLAFPQRGEKLP